jgi:hypothetical protein
LYRYLADGTDYLGLGESVEPNFDTAWPLLKQVFENSEGMISRQEIRSAWPEGAVPPAPQTLWRWLERCV